MVAAYLNELQALLEVLDSAADIEARHFFSGAAAYADGRIFASLTPAGLALKLSEEDGAAMRELGAQPLQYFPKAPIKKGYLVLPEPVTQDRAALAGWMENSVAYVLTLQTPRPKSGGR